MDLRKLKTLIDLVQNSGISELEISEGEEKIRIAKYAPSTPAATYAHAPAPVVGWAVGDAVQLRGRAGGGALVGPFVAVAAGGVRLLGGLVVGVVVVGRALRAAVLLVTRFLQVDR